MIRYTVLLAVIGYACCGVVKTVPKWSTKLTPQVTDPEYLDLEENYVRLLDRDLAQDGADFLELIDFEALITIALEYMEDEEVMNLLLFVVGPEFKELLLEFEAMAEFKEAVSLLGSRGYDPTPAINLVHGILSLPPFQTRSGAGINGLVENIIDNLPMDRIKDLFQDKLQSSPQFVELHDVLTSEEFVDILRRMSANEQFLESKKRLEDLGFDFERIRDLIAAIL